jgi:hypothetical protein
MNEVVIEFLYWDPSTDPHWCPDCEPWIIAYDQFLEKNGTMNRIQGNYTSQVFVNWTEYNSPYSEALRNLYGINNRNSLVIKSSDGNVTVIQDDFNETHIREIIDLYLQQSHDANAYRVFINGTEIAYTLLPCSNSTHSYIYFNYSHSTQEVIIIPEFPSFLILPMFMTATLLAVIVFRRKRERN